MNLSRSIIRAVLWAGPVLAVIATGVVFIPIEYEGVGFWEALYRSIHLFFFDSLEPFPHSWPLVLIVYIAPVIAMAAAGTIVTYLFRLSPALQTRWARDHVIVCGVGRMGKLLCADLRAEGARVVGVDRGPAEEFDEWRAETRVPVLTGDFHSRAALDRAGAQRARSIVFASGNDLANLEAAVGAYAYLRAGDGPVRLLWVHVADEKLATVAREAIHTEGRVDIRFFDSYSLAAARMVGRHFGPGSRAGVAEVSIVGFGKFGRDLFEALARSLGPDESGLRFFVIDRADRSRQVAALAEELGLSGRVAFERNDVKEMAPGNETGRAFFLCTDDDLGNLTAAMGLAHRCRCAHIFVRMAQWPMTGVAEHLGEERGVTFINLNELMIEGIRGLPGIFAPAVAADLRPPGK
jgi:hypothetical protein